MFKHYTIEGRLQIPFYSIIRHVNLKFNLFNYANFGTPIQP